MMFRGHFTKRFQDALLRLEPPEIEAIKEAVKILLENPLEAQNSLRTKRVQGTDHIWEARASRELRFTWEYGPERRYITFRNCGHHDETLKRP